MVNLDPRVISGLIAFGTAMITIFAAPKVKSYFEKRFYLFKLETEYNYEQRKKLKGILSKSKIQLLNACESLNDRLWNFTTHYKDNWHNVQGKYNNKERYYFNSFVYRFVSVFSWIKKIEDEMVYLDTTIATKEDMDFVKFLRLFPLLVCDVHTLFKRFSYDPFEEKDHFFRHNLEVMAQCLIEDKDKDKSICTFSQFQEKLDEYMERLHSACKFIDGVSPDEEDGLRWDRLQVLHIALIAFINSFGYDFQRTSDDEIKGLLGEPRKSKLIANFVELVDKNGLSKQKELENIIRVITKE
jgi:hypothetical protein